MATPPFFGPELLVNTTTAGSQLAPSITPLANGKFVSVWHDDGGVGGDQSFFAVRGQLYNADGSKAGSEFLVNQTAIGSQFNPVVAGLSDGRFVVTWIDDQITGVNELRGRIFNLNGTPAGDEFNLRGADLKDARDVSISALKNGGFVATWTHEFNAADNDVHSRIFDKAGEPVSIEFAIDEDGQGEDEEETDVAVLANGNYVAVWANDGGSSGETDGSGSHIRAQIRSATGLGVSNEFIVNTTTGSDQFDPSVTGLSNGTFVVTWTHNFAGSGDFDIRGRVFGANGAPVSEEFSIATSSAKDETTSSVTALANGAFMVAWTESQPGGGDKDGVASEIGARVFNADGTPAGEAFIVNSTRNGDQREVELTTLADGRVLASWSEDADDAAGDQGNIRAQIIDPRTAAVRLDGGGLDDDWIGTKFADTMNGNDGDDRLVASGGDDSLNGGTGNDLLDGGTGADLMVGGAGNDTYKVDNAADLAIEKPGEGIDTVISSIAFSLAADVENLRLTGVGDPAAKTSTTGVNGTGNALGNAITGSDAANLIDGGAGDDRLSGGLGKDKLTGGEGDDSFVFDAALGKANADKIGGFKSKDDSILLDSDLFDGLAVGELKKKAYFEGAKAHDANDRVILTDKGKLLFDQDGKGGEKAVLFAKVGKDADLSHHDFIVI